MASGGCKDTFVALVDCVVAAATVKDGSGTPTATTTQPQLPCLDVADSFKKCLEEDASKYAQTLDLIATVSGAGEADADSANRRLVSELMNARETALKAQKAAAEMEFCKVCGDAFDALKDCVAAAGGRTATTLPLPCLEAVSSLVKCVEEQEHAGEYICMLNRIAVGAGDGEVGVTANRRVDD